MSRPPLRKMYARPGAPPACIGCGVRLPSSVARVQVEGRGWACPDCAYRLEHPDAARVVRPRKPSKPQAEELPLYEPPAA